MASNDQWKTLSAEYIFQDDWCKLRRDSYQTPSGKIVSPYYVYDFPDWVTALPVTAEGKVIMIRQYRHAIGRVCLELPGGCVDAGDDSMETAIARELREETGYTFSKYTSLGTINANPSTNSNWMHIFLATGGVKTGHQELDPNEEIEVVEFTIDEVKQLLRENKIEQAMHVACIFYALEKINALQY